MNELKRLAKADLIDMNYAYQNLGLALEEFQKGTPAGYELGLVAFQLVQKTCTQVLQSMGINVLLEDIAAPTPPLTLSPEVRHSGIQKPEVKAEQPLSNEAAGYIPPALLRTPSNAEIYAHTMDRTDASKGR